MVRIRIFDVWFVLVMFFFYLVLVDVDIMDLVIFCVGVVYGELDDFVKLFDEIVEFFF